MPTYRRDEHLNRKVPLVETDDIANGAVTRNKLSSDIIRQMDGFGESIEHLSEQSAQAIEIADSASALAREAATHPTTIDGDGWVWEYDFERHEMVKTDKRIVGKDGRDGIDGQDGRDGQDGQSGQSCVCPKIYIMSESAYASLTSKEAGALYFLTADVSSGSTSLGGSLPIILGGGGLPVAGVFGDNLPIILN